MHESTSIELSAYFVNDMHNFQITSFFSLSLSFSHGCFNHCVCTTITRFSWFANLTKCKWNWEILHTFGVFIVPCPIFSFSNFEIISILFAPSNICCIYFKDQYIAYVIWPIYISTIYKLEQFLGNNYKLEFNANPNKFKRIYKLNSRNKATICFASIELFRVEYMLNNE